MKKNFTILMLLALCCLGLNAKTVTFTVTDVITGDKLLEKYQDQGSEEPGTYYEFNEMQFLSDAVYNGKCIVRTDLDNVIMFDGHYNTRGFITTVSGGRATKFSITWGTGNEEMYWPKLELFAKDNGNPYYEVKDIYKSDTQTCGDSFPPIKCAGDKTVSTYTLPRYDGFVYEYIGFKAYYDYDYTSMAQDIFIDKIEVVWEVTDDKVAVPVGAAGITTFCFEYDLDFSAQTNLTAYVATKTGENTVTLKEVQHVPANTGVIVIAEPNTQYKVDIVEDATIEMTEEEEELIVSNQLIGVTQDTKVNYGDATTTNYLLLLDDNNEAAFHPLKSTYIHNLPARKAYLSVTQAVGIPPIISAPLKIVFDEEEVTGIEAVNCEEVENGDAYNLQGIKVDSNYKGIIIKNGKKFYNR